MPINAAIKKLVDDTFASDFPKKGLKQLTQLVLSRQWAPDETELLECRTYLIRQ